jgi:hypothetical protein
MIDVVAIRARFETLAPYLDEWARRDGGGITCRLDIGGPDTSTPYIVSITHLIFTRRSPLFRQIDAYQRHRIKKIKLQNSGDY